MNFLIYSLEMTAKLVGRDARTRRLLLVDIQKHGGGMGCEYMAKNINKCKTRKNTSNYRNCEHK